MMNFPTSLAASQYSGVIAVYAQINGTWDGYFPGEALPPDPAPGPGRINPQIVTPTEGSTVTILNDSEDGMTVIDGTAPLNQITIAWPSYSVVQELQKREVLSKRKITSVIHTIQGGGSAAANLKTSFQINGSMLAQVVQGQWMQLNPGA